MKGWSIKTLVIASAGVFCISIAYFIFLKSPKPEALTFFSEVVGIISGVWTIAIGYLLYDRFGLQAVGKQRQLDAVLDLNRRITKRRVIISTSDGDSMSFPLIRIMMLDFKNQIDEKTLQKIVCFEASNFSGFISAILTDQMESWLPSEIDEKVRSLQFSSFHGGLQNPDTHLMFAFDFMPTPTSNWMKSMPTISANEYLQRLADLLDQIGIWLSKNNSDVLIPQ